MCKHVLKNVFEQKQFAASQLNVELKVTDFLTKFIKYEKLT